MPNGIHPPGSGRPGGSPPGGGGFPGGGRPPGNFPRFFPQPYSYGFPRNRCDWYDRSGRCCDQFGRCDYTGGYGYEGYPLVSMSQPTDSWYGIPGVWDIMPGLNDGHDDIGDI